MPEGHTIHRLAGDLDTAFKSVAPQVTSPQGRFNLGAARIDGVEWVGAQAWGKHLFVDFVNEQILHVHLGLIGKFSVVDYAAPLGVPDPRGQVRLRLVSDAKVADLRGPIICAIKTPEEVSSAIKKLGPDPLRESVDSDHGWRKVHNSQRSIAELLMDQSVVAGVGNVYRCEVLFRHRVNPLTAGSRIKRHTWQAMWDDLVRLLPLGVQTGRIFTDEEQVLRLEANPGLTRIPRPKPYVYRRTGESCRRCTSRVVTRVIAGRNLFWCANCQRRT